MMLPPSPRPWTKAITTASIASTSTLSSAGWSAVTALTAFGNEFGGVAVAPGGDLYVSDTAGNRIWRIPARASGGGSVPISVQPAGIVNGATFTPGIAPGGVVSIFGSGLAAVG